MGYEMPHDHRSCVLGLWVSDYEYNIRVLFVFIALQLLMAYSPFGFIIMSTISVTTLFVGVLAAALWGGPVMGAIVGTVFGLASMWEASVTAVNVNDLIFSPLYSGNPIGSMTLALVPRILFGITAGLTYLFVLKIKNTKIRISVLVIVTVLLDRVQSMFTYLFMDIVFHVEGASAGRAFRNMFSSKRMIQYGITVLIVLCCYYFYEKVLSKKFYQEYKSILEQRLTLRRWEHYTIVMVLVIVICVTLMHLWDRQKIILYEINLLQPEQINDDRMRQVLFQFIVSTFSAIYMVFVFYRHARNVEEVERLQITRQLDREKMKAEEYAERSIRDGLTGVYNRKGLAQIVEQENLEQKSMGYLLIDVDGFKDINDTYGHDVGDEVLKRISQALVKEFDSKWVFRLGGDEFAVFVFDDITQHWKQLCEKIQNTYIAVNDQIREDFAVTMSIGAYYCRNGYSEDAYRMADDALYETKRKGKDGCCLIGTDGSFLEYWKDDRSKAFQKHALELEHGGICKIVFSDTSEFKPRLFCNEIVKSIADIRRDATPEECYQIWFSRLQKENQVKVKEIRNQIFLDGTFSFDYTWNHPTKGALKIKSGGTGEISKGVGAILAYYHSV